MLYNLALFIFSSLTQQEKNKKKSLSIPIPCLILVHHRVIPCHLGHHSRHSLPLHTHHTSLLRHHASRLSHHTGLLRHHTRCAVIACSEWTKGIILACVSQISASFHTHTPHHPCFTGTKRGSYTYQLLEDVVPRVYRNRSSSWPQRCLRAQTCPERPVEIVEVEEGVWRQSR